MVIIVSDLFNEIQWSLKLSLDYPCWHYLWQSVRKLYCQPDQCILMKLSLKWPCVFIDIVLPWRWYVRLWLWHWWCLMIQWLYSVVTVCSVLPVVLSIVSSLVWYCIDIVNLLMHFVKLSVLAQWPVWHWPLLKYSHLSVLLSDVASWLTWLNGWHLRSLFNEMSAVANILFWPSIQVFRRNEAREMTQCEKRKQASDWKLEKVAMREAVNAESINVNQQKAF